MADVSTILHIDGDDFFASLIRATDPRLRKRALIIGNLRSRGAVVAVSRELRGSEISPGIAMSRAVRLYPEAVAVQVDWELVRRVSGNFMKILADYSPVVEGSGLDSAFIDYTGCRRLFGPVEDFTRRLQRRIREELTFTVSAGVAPDKAVSAVACRAAKRGRFTGVSAGEEQRFLESCPIVWLPGIDHGLETFFRERGIRTIGDLSRMPREILEEVLGGDGKRLAARASGRERAAVRRNIRRDLCMARMEFTSDLIDLDRCMGRLAELAGELATQLRARDRSAGALVLSLTYSDGVETQGTAGLDPPTHRDPEIFQAARPVLRRLYHRRVRVRKLALTARRLTYCPPELPFGAAARRMKWNRALAAADAIRRRFPGHAIRLGTAIAGNRLAQSHTR